MEWGFDFDFIGKIFLAIQISFCRASERSCSFTAASGTATDVEKPRVHRPT